MKPDMCVKLVKEPDNDYAKEAIKVEMEGLGTVGYVSNRKCKVHSVICEYADITFKVNEKVFW